ncbi:hypothetical protein CC1G_09399 [Coprinopsis cinerea okayama7|uniref:Uncharacterized protein n=1 Tax=Coprinopsis cinerea (strain Okayama-7 / 130 / ATCC MYA-4618 / FGSC 9003) TaxID=240176 RepID=A8NB39_COPC7|nr:hypothetical protein CC1G_09399 [Coprinopsis cinerea okayama7\|eukprot:XP_001832041.2 hypothetical protein CC1G_09399 [Coprinopsis cinerea okayama7\
MAPLHRLIEIELREMQRYLPELQVRRNYMREVEEKITLNQGTVKAFPHIRFPDLSKSPFLKGMLEQASEQRRQALLEVRISVRLLQEYLTKLEEWEQSKWYEGPPTHPALTDARQSLLKELTEGTIATLLKEAGKHTKPMEDDFTAAIKLVSESLTSLF